jgi:hypothetical protein
MDALVKLLVFILAGVVVIAGALLCIAGMCLFLLPTMIWRAYEKRCIQRRAMRHRVGL